MYPHELPEGLEITKVVRFEDEDRISIAFSDTTISVEISFNITSFDEYINTNVYTYNSINFYSVTWESDNKLKYSMYALDDTNNVLYSIIGRDEAQIHELIQNFY